MQTLTSPLFRPLPLTEVFNIDRMELPTGLHISPVEDYFGERTLLGMPFSFGIKAQCNVILLSQEAVVIDLTGTFATYLLIVHRVEDIKTRYLTDFADHLITGDHLGQSVSDYELIFADGSRHIRPILRRFAIQQSSIIWGASPFAAVPAAEIDVFPTASEAYEQGTPSFATAGRSETRQLSSRDGPALDPGVELPWIYALHNPYPDRPLRSLVCRPTQETSVVYAVTSTTVKAHPLRPGPRKTVRLTLPAGARLNPISEYGELGIDLGTIISARAGLDYNEDKWLSDDPRAEPDKSDQRILVEYEAREGAKLYVSSESDGQLVYDLDAFTGPHVPAGVTVVEPAARPVLIEVLDADTKQPLAARLHMHGEVGEYLPTRGHHRKVNPYWFEDNSGEHLTVHNQYSYIDGSCEADLPLGKVFIEIAKGYEYKQLRTAVRLSTDTKVLRFELQKTLDWRDQGWVSADTHVHFLSPQTALMEGRAEGVNVVNLLAAQWGELFSNVTDFDGSTTLGARDFGGDGEYLVRVGTENRMQVLGHISLLGYSGSMIHPLSTGGPTEGALGDSLESSLVAWARQCAQQRGLAVLPHAPHPQAERAAAIVLGVIDAMEMKTHNPLVPDCEHLVSPYGLADWYRYLNIGYHLPIVGGSDKMSANHLLGGIRTYVHLSSREFSYENWMSAIRRGNTFVTVGPLLSLQVEGVSPGGTVQLPAGGGKVAVDWLVASEALPLYTAEIIVGGLVVEEIDLGGRKQATGTCEVQVDRAGWLALRVRGSYRGERTDVAAHTSAVQVTVGGAQSLVRTDAEAVLDQIQGAAAYVDTLATPFDHRRHREIRAGIEAAYNTLHQKLHRAGTFHNHQELHNIPNAAEH